MGQSDEQLMGRLTYLYLTTNRGNIPLRCDHFRFDLFPRGFLGGEKKALDER